jgi:hypothetical protein
MLHTSNSRTTLVPAVYKSNVRNGFLSVQTQRAACWKAYVQQAPSWTHAIFRCVNRHPFLFFYFCFVEHDTRTKHLSQHTYTTLHISYGTPQVGMKVKLSKRTSNHSSPQAVIPKTHECHSTNLLQYRYLGLYFVKKKFVTSKIYNGFDEMENICLCFQRDGNAIFTAWNI